MLRGVRIPEKDVLKRLLDELQTVDSRTDSFAVFCRAMSQIGFSGAIFGTQASGPGWKEAISETSFPPAWVEHYLHNNYTKTDPARRFCLRTALPFFWSETFPHFRKKELAIFSEARDFGLATGIVTPIYSGGMLMGAVGLSSDSAKAEDVRLKTTINIAAQIFCTIYNQILEEEKAAPSTQETRTQVLTKREMEIVYLLSQGLSNHQLSDTLHVSLSAVEYHVKNIFTKLNVENRVSAVVKAIKLGLIDP